MATRPQAPAQLEWIYDAFALLNSYRQSSGMGSQRLSYEAVDRYLERMHPSLTRQDYLDALRYLRALDNEYLDVEDKRLKAKQAQDTSKARRAG